MFYEQNYSHFLIRMATVFSRYSRRFSNDGEEFQHLTIEPIRSINLLFIRLPLEEFLFKAMARIESNFAFLQSKNKFREGREGGK